MDPTLPSLSQDSTGVRAASAGAHRWDARIAVLGIVAALAALPLPAHASSPEFAGALLIGAVALLTGHRWALGVVVIAEVLLVAALWPLAFVHHPPSVPAQIAVAIACGSALPGLLALGRAAPELFDLVGLRLSGRAHRIAYAGLAMISFALIAAPALR